MGGAGADFFRQLKLDFFIDKVKVFFCVIKLSTIATRPYTVTVVKLQFHQISIYLISILKFFLIIMSLLSKKRIT